MFGRKRTTSRSGFTYLDELPADQPRIEGCRVMLTGNGKILQVLTMTEVVTEVSLEDVSSVTVDPASGDGTVTTLHCAGRPSIRLWRAGDERDATRALVVPMAALHKVWSRRS